MSSATHLRQGSWKTSGWRDHSPGSRRWCVPTNFPHLGFSWRAGPGLVYKVLPKPESGQPLTELQEFWFLPIGWCMSLLWHCPTEFRLDYPTVEKSRIKGITKPLWVPLCSLKNELPPVTKYQKSEQNSPASPAFAEMVWSRTGHTEATWLKGGNH